VDLSEFSADIIICLAVIQHFPNKTHLDNFLENLNRARARDIVLQIRSYPETKFNQAYNSETRNKGLACTTNHEYIDKFLTNFKLRKEGDISDKSKYQYLIYERV
jgi:hypothetical protein